MKKTAVIIAAAGSGARLGLRTKKPFILLKGHPLVSYTLRAFEDAEDIDAIVVAGEAVCINRLQAVVKKYRIKKVIDIVPGGDTRQESVRNALRRVPSDYGTILIHDGGRPFVDKGIISRCITAAKRYGAAIAAIPANDTIKFVYCNNIIKNTMDRSKLFRAQTPQAFKREIIEKAFSRKDIAKATDDSMLVEALGGRVRVVEGSYKNIKVTTREDLMVAGVLLSRRGL